VDAAYDNQKFGGWIRSQRERLGLSEEEFAEQLGLSVATVVMWEVGNTPWAVLPKEIKRKIEVVCGKFPSVEDAGIQYIFEARPADGMVYQNTILNEIEEHGIEFVCNRCRTPIPLKAGGTCPDCGKRADGAQ
jgi:transcriptional regulator with XRE-family HTH domain